MARRLPVPLAPGWFRWLGVAAVLCVISYFSLFAANPAPPVPEPFWDKQLHFAAYAGLALSLAYATATSEFRDRRRIVLVLGTAVLVGVLVEFLQAPLPHRDFSYLDMVADALGTAIVLIWFAAEPGVRYVRFSDI